MTVLETRVADGEQYLTDSERWQAVVRRDRRADELFFYAVKTTGVFCRPSCASRLANVENVRFFSTSRDAERAGFRACRRCRPTEPAAIRGQAARIAEACQLIDSAGETRDLSALAAAVGMSPSHFHRTFKSLVGVTPKAYAASRRSGRVRRELAKSATVTAAVYRAGFQSSGRFYAESAATLGMTPSTFRAGGAGASIRFAVGQCSLGAILVAMSNRGICAILLGDDPGELVHELEDQFPKAELVGADRDFERWIAQVVGLVERPGTAAELPLDVQGTAFQQRVWQLLREIPRGQTISYAELARRAGAPRAVRAVASACAANRIAIAIPCHRVVRSDGSFAGYRWGIERKEKLLKRERS
jgi:AraC family transcriptional regulator, regulatory protein of adaptative response / methylated-DNA-[protein]-cysteine methyltransferase